MADHPAEAALRALSPSQLAFLDSLPKAELHAHLNGSIPLPLLQDLAREYTSSPPPSSDDATTTTTTTTSSAPLAADILAGVQRLQTGVALERIDDFFLLFPAIYALTSTPASLKRVTRGVLSHFLDPAPHRHGGHGVGGAVAYIELRTTPRATAHMSRRVYLETVLDEIEARAPDAAALVVSLDRRMTPQVAREVLELAVQLRREGRRVVGVDLCGDPKAGDMTMFVELFRTARMEGLGVTLHIAETRHNSAAETMQLLNCEPHRLGHATFLDDETKELVLARRTCIEICLTSNLLCKTVQQLQDHHIRHYLARNHPIAICTDDILPFRNSVLGEYALLMAPKPVGLGLTEGELETVARMGMESRFPNTLR
ncbi:adenosine deaminase-like protein [Lactifluus subvellereus]|nr:adenosine deaminase-like protein [Lactifluus subvellereus]